MGVMVLHLLDDIHFYEYIISLFSSISRVSSNALKSIISKGNLNNSGILILLYYFIWKTQTHLSLCTITQTEAMSQCCGFCANVYHIHFLLTGLHHTPLYPVPAHFERGTDHTQTNQMLALRVLFLKTHKIIKSF